MTSSNYISSFVASLFENGIETYDASAPANERIKNVGGAKLYWQQNYKNNQGQIVFNNDAFRKAITNFPASLYSCNRVQLDNNRNPVKLVAPLNGYRRINNSLMLYSTFDQDENAGKDMRDRFLEIMKENSNINLKDYIQVASEIECDKINHLTEITYRDMMGIQVPIKLTAALIIAVPSGAPGSNQLWSTKNKSVNTRTAMSQSVTATDLDALFS